MIEDFETLYQLVATLIAAIAALYGWYEKKKADSALAHADASQEYAQEVQGYFDPANEYVTTPPAGTPAASYTMNDETKQFLLNSESPMDQLSMLEQITDAEKNGLVDYKINYSRGYYKISYGLVASSVKYA